MAPRPAMAALLAKVAALVADPTFAVFTPDAVQAALDRYRTDYRMWPLTESVAVGTDGRYAWTTYYTGGTGGGVLGDWEADALVQANVYTDITALATIDYGTGRVTFAATQYPPVWWTGATYDVWAAAADLAEERAALTSDQYNMANQGQSLARGQVPTNWLALAGVYRRRARVRTSLLARSDGR